MKEIVRFGEIIGTVVGLPLVFSALVLLSKQVYFTIKILTLL